MFTQPVSSILYCYGVWQDYFEKKEIPNLEFHDGLPSIENVKSLHDGKFHIIVLDGLMEHIVKSIETQIYSQNFVIIIIKQQFFLLKMYLLKDLVQIHKY